MKLLILAGGTGTRLWPVSRRGKPKQVQPFFDRSTLLSRTYSRLVKFFNGSNIFVATSQKQFDLIKKELPGVKKSHFLLEPSARGTLAAITLAALHLAKRYPREVVVTINSDHYIGREKEYARILKQAAKVVRHFPATITLFGIRPSYPETGYGYIKMGSQVWKLRQGKQTDEVFAVEKFIEKPTLAKAKQYVRQWEYLWNPGLFAFYPHTLLRLFTKYFPAAAKSVPAINSALGTSREQAVVDRYFKTLPNTSMDYGLIEKMSDLVVLPTDFSWADIGHWRTIHDILAKSAGDNVSRGTYLGVNSRGNLVYSLSGKLIATVGVKNFIIIETEDALLVCPKAEAQQVKQIVAKLEQRRLTKYL